MKAAYIQHGKVHVGDMPDPVPDTRQVAGPTAPVRTVIDPGTFRP